MAQTQLPLTCSVSTVFCFLFSKMPVVSQMQHPRSMPFKQQQKVVTLRDVKKLSWNQIAERVFNLEKKYEVSARQCREVYAEFNKSLGRREYRYGNCGQTPTKMTSAVKKFIIKKLLQLRPKMVCTSTTLQREVAREMHVRVEASSIRKHLKASGYRWLPRAQEPKYNSTDRAARKAFAEKVDKMSQKKLGDHVDMWMDGVVLALPPSDPTERENHCKAGYTHMWRKPSENSKTELGGNTQYAKQIPLARAVPMWGGIGKAGFACVMYHKHKKVCTSEWVKAVKAGDLVRACKEAGGKTAGPYRVGCDNESFLAAPESRRVHALKRVELWQIPPRSPDCNPVEKFWSWVRARLRDMDLKDLEMKRLSIGRSALRERVKRLLRTRKAKEVAKNTVLGLKKVCQTILKKRGGGTRG